jgi:FkbM family methyltransferase
MKPLRQISHRQRFPLSLLRAIPHQGIQRLGFRAYNRALWARQRSREARTYYGATIECDLSDLIQMCVYHFGIWEPHISALIENRLRQGDLFCDVGANIGYHSLLGSCAVGPSGKVIAIEASPMIYGKLRKNLCLNRVTNVETVNVAVTAEPGQTPIYKGFARNIGTASTVRSRGHGLEAVVQGLPLASIVSAEDRRRLRLVKIDVEGAELSILELLANCIREYSPNLEIIAEVTPDTRLRDVFDHFGHLGFSSWAIANSYNVTGYLNFDKVRTPIPLSTVPTRHRDVFLSRSYPDRLAELASTEAPMG